MSFEYMKSQKSQYPLQYKLADLVNGLDVAIKGDPDCLISGVSSIQRSQSGHITFLTNALYRKYLNSTQASAVILKNEDAQDCLVNAIISNNPYYTYAKIAAFFSSKRTIEHGVHPTAMIGKHCQIDPTAAIGPYCVIGDHVMIATHAVIGPGCIIGDQVEIGEGSELDAKVTLYHQVKIGKRVHIASGAVIGRDGFGFANQQGVWHKVPQLGSVEIGDEVDIGANTTIDRGALENTIIGRGAKLDNLIQIGHNVCIGENTIIAGCVGIAGSTVIGKNCMIGGKSAINGHVTICDNVLLTGMTTVANSILEPGMYSSGVVGAVPSQEFRRNNARFYRLGNLMQRVKKLEDVIKNLKNLKI